MVVVSTGVLFANLLYKAQVTGYMIFNAEQQVQLQLSPFSSAATGTQAQPQNLLLPTTGGDTSSAVEEAEQQQQQGPVLSGLVTITAQVGAAGRQAGQSRQRSGWRSGWGRGSDGNCCCCGGGTGRE